MASTCTHPEVATAVPLPVAPLPTEPIRLAQVVDRLRQLDGWLAEFHAAFHVHRYELIARDEDRLEQGVEVGGLLNHELAPVLRVAEETLYQLLADPRLQLATELAPYLGWPAEGRATLRRIFRHYPPNRRLDPIAREPDNLWATALDRHIAGARELFQRAQGELRRLESDGGTPASQAPPGAVAITAHGQAARRPIWERMVVDRDKPSVRFDGKEVWLGCAEEAIYLLLLVSRRGVAAAGPELVAEVPELQAKGTHLGRIKDKLPPAVKRLIKVVQGKGHRLISPAEESELDSPS